MEKGSRVEEGSSTGGQRAVKEWVTGAMLRTHWMEHTSIQGMGGCRGSEASLRLLPTAVAGMQHMMQRDATYDVQPSLKRVH